MAATVAERTDRLFSAIESGDVATVGALLDEEPALVDARRATGESAVLHAVYRMQSGVRDLLLARGVTLGLHEAAAAGEERALALADADPAQVNALSPDGFAPLHLACFFGHPALVDGLLARGADANAVSRNAMAVRPLHSAAAHGGADARLTISRALLAGGADARPAQHGGWTPLHQAAATGDAALARLLLDHGADPAARSDDGKLPADMARERGHLELAASLGA